MLHKRRFSVEEWKGVSNYYTGTFPLPVNEPDGKWAAVVVTQSLHNSPTGSDPAWSEKGPAHFGTTRSYDPTPDGKQVVALMSADTLQEPHARVIFLLNFFDELRRRLPPSLNPTGAAGR
jgi:hypothetical protein